MANRTRFHAMLNLGQFIFLFLMHSVRTEKKVKFGETTLSISEERERWIDEFDHLKTAPPNEMIQNYFKELERERERTRNTPEIEIFDHKARAKTMKQYWWDVLDDAPDYPEHPNIKSGKFTGETKEWPTEETSGTTKSTTFRFSSFRHRIPDGMISKLRHTDDP